MNLGLINPGLEEEEDTSDELTTIGNYQDGSDIVLVFRVLARMCDGQYRSLQVVDPCQIYAFYQYVPGWVCREIVKHLPNS